MWVTCDSYCYIIFFAPSAHILQKDNRHERQFLRQRARGALHRRRQPLLRRPRAWASTSTTAACCKVFREKGRLVRAYYYTALVEDQEYSPIRPLIDWLDYNGYTMVTKPTKEFTDAMGRRKIKGNMDIELAIDVLEMAEHLDHVILFSGDGDFRRLVEAVQRRGLRVSVVSTIKSAPPMVADELRRQADDFIELAELAPLIARNPSERTPRPAVPPSSASAIRTASSTTPVRSADAVGLVATLQWLRSRSRSRRSTVRAVPGSSAFRHELAGQISRLEQRAGPLVRRPRRAPADRRPGARHEGRQPHRPALHRRLCRRPALLDPAEVRLRPGHLPAPIPTTGCAWSTAASPTPCAACRPRTSRCPSSSPTAGRSCRPSWR